MAEIQLGPPIGSLVPVTEEELMCLRRLDAETSHRILMELWYERCVPENLRGAH